MRPSRIPALLLAGTALAFLIWAVVLVLSPGGSVVLEWAQLGVSSASLLAGLVSVGNEDRRRAVLIRWVLTGYAVFGGLVVIGLTADDTASRTWVRLGWAALASGLVSSLIGWWSDPRVSRRAIGVGGVLGLVVIGGGAGITANCDKSVQRSWCDAHYEQEGALAARIDVDGTLQRAGRAGGGGRGPAFEAYLIDGTSIETVTDVPDEFVYEERPIQSNEVVRGRYTAGSGPDSSCQVDVRIEIIPAGNLETLTVSCSDTG